MTSFVENQGYSYPQLYVVEAGSDYRRFDRLHTNTADDGIGVDEIGVLWGAGSESYRTGPGWAQRPRIYHVRRRISAESSPMTAAPRISAASAAPCPAPSF
jgi:hypothetical protein